MAANKSEREFAKILGLPEEMLLESFKEHLEKKEKEGKEGKDSAPPSEAGSASGSSGAAE